VNKFLAHTRSIFDTKASLFLPVLLLIYLCSHLPYMQVPASGNHVWRQCNTLAVARNYYEEDMRILYPRVDKRYNKSGITGPQFTAYDWTLAAIYKVFGFSETAHRWLSLFIMMAAIWAMYLLAFQYSGNRMISGVAASFLAFVPELYYHSINAVPDILSLAAMLWAWFLGRKWVQTGNNWACIASAILFALAGMVKMQFLVAGIAVGVEFLSARKFGLKRMFQVTVLILIAVIPTIWWYSYAANLVKIYGLHEFVHAMRHARNMLEFFTILGQTLFLDLPETLVGYGFLVFFVFGIWISKKYCMQFPGLLAYAIGCALFYFLVQYQFIHHGYYAIIFFPIFALTVGVGFYKISQTRYALLLAFIWIAPFWAWMRMHQNWEIQHSRYPAAFVRQSFRDSASKLSDSATRWVVGPDETGCVYFYFLHAKGYPWDTPNIATDALAKYHEQGAGGFITNDTVSLHKAAGNLKLVKVGEVDGFIWYRIP